MVSKSPKFTGLSTDAHDLDAQSAVVFWGILHAACQAVICVAMGGPGELQRWLTLVAGLLLPAISLVVALFALDDGGTAHKIVDLVPALCYDDMIADGPPRHNDTMFFALTFGVWCLLLCISLLLLFV
jgi:hypothetical protein